MSVWCLCNMGWVLVICVSVCVSCILIGDRDVLNMTFVGGVCLCLCSLTAVCCVGVLALGAQ